MTDLDQQANEATDPPKLYQFVGLVFLWLIPCFIVWVSLSSLIAGPAVWVTELILTSALPDVVHGFTLTGAKALLSTHFGELDGEIVSAQVAGYRLAYHLNTQVLSYSLPFYAALHFATPADNDNRDTNGLARFGRGLLVLYPLFIFGLIAVNLKNLMLGLGGVFIDGSSFGASAIGMMYQFSTLMIPPLAPIMVWGWQSRQSALLQQLLVKTVAR